MDCFPNQMEQQQLMTSKGKERKEKQKKRKKRRKKESEPHQCYTWTELHLQLL